MTAIGILTKNGIKILIRNLKDYTRRLPFDGTVEKSPAAGIPAGIPGEKKAARTDGNLRKWPGVMRGYGPITKLYDWEDHV
jgi:hypothetical protein